MTAIPHNFNRTNKMNRDKYRYNIAVIEKIIGSL